MPVKRELAKLQPILDDNRHIFNKVLLYDLLVVCYGAVRGCGTGGPVGHRPPSFWDL